MVYRDYWALSQWYAHFGRHLGHENLFVVAHGADPEIQRICPKANIFTVPRNSLEHFDLARSQMLNGFQIGLNAMYDWVIRTDADELICLDPKQYSSFSDFFGAQSGNSVFALGINLAKSAQDAPLQQGIPALGNRKNAIFSAHYSKAWAVRNRVGLLRHGVLIRPRLVNKFHFMMPPGVYLVHLKFANKEALIQSNKLRREIAHLPVQGLPGNAWKDPSTDARKFFDMLDTLPFAPWAEAEAQAFESISVDPVRDPQKGFVRAKNVRLRTRTLLPDWFSALKT